MNLSELQLDALTEVFNVGAGQAAANLSEIVGDEVRLSVPRIQFYDRTEINPGTLALADQRVGSVRQLFSGPFNLDASLLFKEERALEIVQEMIGSQVRVEDLVDFEQEAMCELGNIILNGCMSTIADVLQIELTSTLPEYTVAASDVVVGGLVSDMTQPVIMVLHIDLTIEKRQTHGYLVFLLSSGSLAELVVALDRFLGRI
ncbi:chemotaxis protein CheC [Rhodoferax koreense]|uniref:Chemotaxis protein CheC n=1 Tax=Rhodoferax koreensis TaxID=1842727 RepID=A0A1P8JWF8_9BURK|nr:chemotaxis protein CheC [Rhodoferax koreense]APW38085.1 chemotaxis protein CheC [Rhodoferax koreense]